MAGFRVINIDAYPLGSRKPNIYPVSLFLKVLQTFNLVRSKKKCCQILILNAAVDGRNTMKVANILTENQGQSFINFSILCVLLVGILFYFIFEEIFKLFYITVELLYYCSPR
jgi:hypothetical protein